MVATKRAPWLLARDDMPDGRPQQPQHPLVLPVEVVQQHRCEFPERVDPWSGPFWASEGHAEDGARLC